MNIRSTSGNILHNVQDNLSSALISGKTAIENIVGTATTSLSNIWGGGFTGMSKEGIEELKTSLNKYCQEIEELIGGFDQNGDITMALQGDTQTAAYDFIDAIKQLLQAYVSTMRQEIDEADEAYNNFAMSSQSISQDVESAAQDIRSNASQIRLD